MPTKKEKSEIKNYKWACYLNEVENDQAKVVAEYLFKKKLTDRKSRYALIKFALKLAYGLMLKEIEEEQQDRAKKKYEKELEEEELEESDEYEDLEEIYIEDPW